MKTPEEIKKGMEACILMQGCIRSGCPYSNRAPGSICIHTMVGDALAYIQQLESSRMSKPHDDNKLTPKDFDFSKKGIPPETPPLIQGRIEIDEIIKESVYVKKLESRLAQVERERDAAVFDLENASPCFACYYFIRNRGACKGGRRCCGKQFRASIGISKYDGPEWQWRGVCAENTEDKE